MAGGVSLDLLGLVVIVQYGTIFVTTKIYWLLLIIPIWGCYKLYTTFFGGGKGGGLGGLMGGSSNQMMGNDNGKEQAVDPQLAEKRQKRAERRRQKWS